MKSTTTLSLRAAFALVLTPLLAHAGTSTNTSGNAGRNDGPGTTKNPALTVSLSGQTALRNFSAGAGVTFIEPGTSVTLNNGPGGTPITYTATNVAATQAQLASSDFTLADTGVDYSSGVPNVQRQSALRVEWHEQGSGEGLIDLINDQIGYIGGLAGTPLSNVLSRGPSASNPTWVNTNQFQGATTAANPYSALYPTGQSLGGHFLATANYGNTYDSSVYDLPTGANKQGGQNRVQISIGECKIESLSKTGGTTTPFVGAGAAGYGQGNRALVTPATVNGLGFSGDRQQFRPDTVANESNTKTDPQTSSVYADGPWNSAGTGNIDSKQIAVTAVTLAANPGTGLTRLNLSDSRWLQTAGRLQNGADFNAAARSIDTGQRIVPALATGIDPSWAVGDNDDGNTSGTAQATAQRQIGPNFRLSGKTSGTEERNAIAQSRLGFGPLSLAEARGASSGAPVRALDVDFTDLTDPTVGGSIDTSKFIHLDFDSIVNFNYKAVLISHYNTIKAPRPDLLAAFRSANPGATAADEQAWWNGLTSLDTGIKGDTTGAAKAFIQNVTNSTGTAAAGLTASSVKNPADSLFINGFLIPQLLNYSRQYDGGPLTPNSLSPQQLALQQDVKANYGFNFTPDGSAGSSTQTAGSGATYGALGTVSAVNGAVPITANNYLFGNFNQDGKRDFKSVKESVNAALSLHHADGAASSIFTANGGVVNSTVVPPLAGTPGWASGAPTKGDLVVLGDFNTDGAFDGRDVYLLARGAALSDNAGTDQLTAASGASFADQVRNPNARLNKNAALDYAQTATATGSDLDQKFLRQTGRATLTGASLPSGATQVSSVSGVVTYTFDPNGDNAFNKLDVNRDGRVTRDDAKIVDGFVGQNYHNLDQSLGAVVRTDLNPGGTPFANGLTPLDPTDPANASIPRRQISLVDVELTDDGEISSIGAASSNDLRVIASALVSSGKLLAGDVDFSGGVTFDDLLILAQNYGKLDASLASGTAGFTGKWTTGDETYDGIVNFDDLLALSQNYSQSVTGSFASDWALAQTLAPEPTALAIFPIVTLALRRRRR